MIAVLAKPLPLVIRWVKTILCYSMVKYRLSHMSSLEVGVHVLMSRTYPVPSQSTLCHRLHFSGPRKKQNRSWRTSESFNHRDEDEASKGRFSTLGGSISQPDAISIIGDVKLCFAFAFAFAFAKHTRHWTRRKVPDYRLRQSICGIPICGHAEGWSSCKARRGQRRVNGGQYNRR